MLNAIKIRYLNSQGDEFIGHFSNIACKREDDNLYVVLYTSTPADCIVPILVSEKPLSEKDYKFLIEEAFCYERIDIRHVGPFTILKK